MAEADVFSHDGYCLYTWIPEAYHTACSKFILIVYSHISWILEKAMTSHSSTLAWKLPWTEEPGGLQSVGLLRVGHDWATSLSLFTFRFHALEKEMATHSSVLAWRIPGMAEPNGLPSVGSHRVGHDWSDLAAAAADEQTSPFFCIACPQSRGHYVPMMAEHISTFSMNLFSRDMQEESDGHQWMTDLTRSQK